MHPGALLDLAALAGPPLRVRIPGEDPEAALLLHARELLFDPPALHPQPHLAQPLLAAAARADVGVGQAHRGADPEEAGQVAGLQEADEREEDLQPEEPLRLDG